jgi:hypothetical protein
MSITRASHWVLGTAMAAAIVAYFSSVAAAENFVDAFEPDLDEWEKIA